MTMILKYLLNKSRIAIELATNDPVSLEDLLMAYSVTIDNFTHNVKLLERLPGFEIDEYNTRVKPHSFKKEGYSSLLGLSYEDIVALHKISDYLGMPNDLCEKLVNVIDAEYETDICIDKLSFEEITAHENSKFHWREFDGFESMSITPEYGIDYMKWLVKNGAKLTSLTFELAMFMNLIECLDYLYNIKYPLDPDGIKTSMYCVVSEGAFDALKWLYEKKEFRKLMREADKDDPLCQNPYSLEILKWLHEHGFQLTDKIYKAECHTLVKCLEYAYAAGIPFGDDKTYSESTGNLEHLIWLHKHGFYFTDETCRTNLEVICGHRDGV